MSASRLDDDESVVAGEEEDDDGDVGAGMEVG